VLFVIFSLSRLPCQRREEGEKSDPLKEMDDRSPRYAFNQQRVLRKGRTEKKSISFSTVPTTGEFVFINTRFFCVAFLGRRFDSCESARFPLCGVFCYAVDNGGKKIWADECMRKKPNQSTFFAKTYYTKPEHIFAPPIL
jgi:hypothetical protein